MGRHLVAPLPAVLADYVLCVDGKPSVRVDGHAKQPRVRLKSKSILLQS